MCTVRFGKRHLSQLYSVLGQSSSSATQKFLLVEFGLHVLLVTVASSIDFFVSLYCRHYVLERSLLQAELLLLLRPLLNGSCVFSGC
jgi:hypothetical protein